MALAKTLGDVRAALKAAVNGLTGVTVYERWPDDPKDIATPAVLIKPMGAQLDGFGGQVTYRFELVVVCQARFSDAAQAQLDDLLSFDGQITTSVFERLWANPGLSGRVESTELTGFRDYGGIEVATQEFIGATIDVEALTTIG